MTYDTAAIEAMARALATASWYYRDDGQVEKCWREFRPLATAALTALRAYEASHSVRDGFERECG